MGDVNELKAILTELDQLFDREDDINDVFDVSKMRREIASQMQRSERDAKELIKAMTSDIARKEGEIMAPTQSEHEVVLRKVSDKENLQRQLNNLVRDIDSTRLHIAKLTESSVTLQERTQEFKVSSSLADSRTAYAVSLYAKISNITWNYTAPSGQLAGCIGNDQRRELRNFSIDTTTMSDFDVTNRLWELIGTNSSSSSA